MAKKTIQVAVWEYLDKDKRRRRAYYGDEVELSAAETKRAKAAGVFGDFDQHREATPPPPEQATTPDTVVVGDAGGGGVGGAPAVDAAPVAAAVGDGDDLDGLGDDDAADADGDTPSADEPVRPRNTAPKPEWVDYAVARGLDRAEAEKMDVLDLRKALAE